MGRKRQVKHVIRRLEKLMKTVVDTQTALQLVFSDIPHVEAVILVLGASPVQPRRVYELCFSHRKDVSDACDFTKTRVAEAFSKKGSV
ncbi:putative mad1/Cdc20-bound-Mad2 binding protein [Helianthus annuus]|nr:putative mad1/Cdc20-bound-Mad2 binding protein [Helianthus annuus]